MANNSTYLAFKEFAGALGLSNVESVYRWEKEGRLEVAIIDGLKMIPREFADNTAREWKRSCKPVEASKRTGIPKGSRSHFVALGVLKTGPVLGAQRVVKSCLKAAKAYYKLKQERQRMQAIKACHSPNAYKFTGKEEGAHRWNGTETNVHRWNSTEAHAAIKRREELKRKKTTENARNPQPVFSTPTPTPPAPKPKDVIPMKKKVETKIVNVYHPVSRLAKERVGDQRLVTVVEAGKFLGMASHMVPVMYFRRTKIDGELLLDAKEVEA